MMTARVITTILRLRRPTHTYIVVMTLAVIMLLCGHHVGALIMLTSDSHSTLSHFMICSSSLSATSLSVEGRLWSRCPSREERRGHHRRDQCHNYQHGKKCWRENSQV